MEYSERIIRIKNKPKIDEHEAERASNSYLMSLIAVIAALPLPIINLFSTLIFYFEHRKGSYFVRWHCMQALLSQISFIFINSPALWWTVYIIVGKEEVTNSYFAYLFTVLIANFFELIATVYAAAKVRQGIHVKWWFYGDITDLIIKDHKKKKEVSTQQIDYVI